MAMAMFDVYVEGATDPSPEATRRLAEVMSQRYGLPANDLVSRLTKGRFRVKANIDQQTARAYASDLETIGARVTVTETRGSTLPPPRPGVSQPPASRSVLPGPSSPPPANRPQPSQPSPVRPGPSVPPGNQQYSSGLAAAFHEDTPVPQLGALAYDDAMSLASLDGAIEASPAIEGGLPASIGPAASPKPAKPDKARPRDEPVDLFAPPDASTETSFELAQDELDHMQARKQRATPPAPSPVVTDKPSSPVLRPRSTTPPPPGVALGGVVVAAATEDEPPRWRFAGGVLAAIILGFLPAHCVASVRESSAFERIDQEVATVEAQANRPDAPVPAARLDEYREEQLALKRSKRRNIALVSMLIWAVSGVGVGYVWFRRVPWDRIKFGQG